LEHAAIVAKYTAPEVAEDIQQLLALSPSTIVSSSNEPQIVVYEIEKKPLSSSGDPAASAAEKPLDGADDGGSGADDGGSGADDGGSAAQAGSTVVTPSATKSAVASESTIRVRGVSEEHREAVCCLQQLDAVCVTTLVTTSCLLASPGRC
jgi:hypothetical protein